MGDNLPEWIQNYLRNNGWSFLREYSLPDSVLGQKWVISNSKREVRIYAKCIPAFIEGLRMR